MFSKDSKTDTRLSTERSLAPVRTSSATVAPSIISANLRVTGDLVSEGDIQIDGVIEGDVRSDSVTVGEYAVVSGGIEAQIINVSGTIKGQINGKVVQLSSTAKVTGDIVHESLSVEAGAFIQGLCRHVSAEGKLANGNGDAVDKTVPNLVVGGGKGNGAEARSKPARNDGGAGQAAPALSAAKG
jgi:cytoskeletal protein CcmA (bactofilin family)